MGVAVDKQFTNQERIYIFGSLDLVNITPNLKYYSGVQLNATEAQE